MRIVTNQDIDFDTWVYQASKFTNGTRQLQLRNLPQNTPTSGKAEILIDIQQPIYEGFDAIITYVQNYTKEVLVDELDENSLPTGNQVLEVRDFKIPIIRYSRIIDVASADALFQSVDATIDASYVGFQRTRLVVLQAILNDVVLNQTFNGLLASDYTLHTGFDEDSTAIDNDITGGSNDDGNGGTGQNVGGTIAQNTSKDNFYNSGFNIFFDMTNTLTTPSTSWKVTFENPNFTITGTHNGIPTVLPNGDIEIVNESYNNEIQPNAVLELQLVGNTGQDGDDIPTYNNVYIEIT